MEDSDSEKRLLRGRILHVPRDPFQEGDCLQAWSDGAVVIEGVRIREAGEYSGLRRKYPGADYEDLRPAAILPGFVDTHLHYPQMPVIGAMGSPLLEWLDQHCLPQEARLQDQEYARYLANRFIQCLLRNGTTTALVFGSHFPRAQEALFDEASSRGVDLASGLVMSDLDLLPELRLSPEQAYDESARLASRWHGMGRIRYAITPRFALSTSEEMLSAASALSRDHPDALITSHVNENADEVEAVRDQFPWASSYTDVYDRFELLGGQSILAHNVHPTSRELATLARRGCGIAHCPSSNAFLGSGLFPLADHVEAEIPVGLGSDVGAGAGFGLLKEALAAYQTQRLHPRGYPLKPSHLLYLITAGGARILGRGNEVGDLAGGKRANLVVVKPQPDTTLAEVWDCCSSDDHFLGMLFCLGGEEAIERIYVEGQIAWLRGVSHEID